MSFNPRSIDSFIKEKNSTQRWLIAGICGVTDQLHKSSQRHREVTGSNHAKDLNF